MNAVKKLMQSKTRLFVILGLLITTISIAATTYFTLAFASSAEISILDANNAVLINTSEKNVQAILTEARYRALEKALREENLDTDVAVSAADIDLDLSAEEAE